LPVVELPVIDFEDEVPPAKEHRPTASFDRALPVGMFVVRFQARQRADQKPMPKAGVLLNVRREYHSGKLITAGACHMKPTGEASAGLVTYQGVCPSLKRASDAIVEVTYGRRSCFVRSARVQ
jgi:hypothetical protein